MIEEDQPNEWKEAVLIKIRGLKQDKNILLQADSQFAATGHTLSEEQRNALYTAVKVIDEQIARLELEIILDDILSGAISLGDDGTITKK